MKVGAGVIGGDAYEVAAAAGYRLIGGECGSVGIAGGFSQGGGHSLLTSAYGMGADQVLEWEVVTADGKHLTASPEKNSDLYWALSGGGAGTYAVVLSMTVKMHKDGPVSGGTLSFASTNPDDYWTAVSLWMQKAPALVAKNNTFLLVIQNYRFTVAAMTLPGQPASAVNTLLSPFFQDLDHFNSSLGPLPYGNQPSTTTLMSRLIPKSVAADANKTSTFVDTLRFIVADGTFLVGCLLFDASHAVHPDNAVLPAWRDAIGGCNLNAFWNFTAPLASNLGVKRNMVDTYVPALEKATPGGAVYMNEMDPWYAGDWKTNLYGKNYDRLRGIKKRYDPSHLLWGKFTVGSDESQVDGAGRLCRV